MEFHVYRDALGGYRWRLLATNHKVIATSGEGYVRKQYAIDMAYKIRDEIASAIVYDITGED